MATIRALLFLFEKKLTTFLTLVVLQRIKTAISRLHRGKKIEEKKTPILKSCSFKKQISLSMVFCISEGSGNGTPIDAKGQPEPAYFFFHCNYQNLKAFREPGWCNG